MNNEAKRQATISGDLLEREVSKLLSNTIYGKTIQSCKNFRHFEVIIREATEEYCRINNIESISAINQISDSVFIFEKEKTKVELNMPIFIGKCILDYSKELMYNWLHKTFLKHYSKGRLLYTDTDGFVLEVPDSEEGWSNFILKNKDTFDLSECENDKLPLFHHLEAKKKELSKEEYESYIS